MKNQIMKTNIGAINLAEIEITTDCIEVLIPVVTVSENLKSTIAENIQKAKEVYQKEFLDCRNMKWSNAGVLMESQSLHIVSDGNKFKYELCYGFSDMENDSLETGFGIEMDLSKHEKELKKLIAKAIIDKFF